MAVRQPGSVCGSVCGWGSAAGAPLSTQIIPAILALAGGNLATHHIRIFPISLLLCAPPPFLILRPPSFSSTILPSTALRCG